MKTKITCLSLAAFVFASCDKSPSKAKPDDTSSKDPRMETGAAAPTITEKPAPAPRDSPADNTRRPIDPPLSHPVTAEIIRPAGTAPDDHAWESLTPEQRIEKFNSSGIARMPKAISTKILADASNSAPPQEQLNIITQQAVAWHRINHFMEESHSMPEHMKKALFEKLIAKHSDAWVNMLPELEEQIAASIRVDEFRSKGIPGLTPDETHELMIKAIEDHGCDYKTILSIAEQAAKK